MMMVMGKGCVAIFLLVLLPQTSGIQSTAAAKNHAATSPPPPPVEILISGSSQMTVYSCFLDDKENLLAENGNNMVIRDVCCEAMVEATKQLMGDEDDGISSSSSSVTSSLFFLHHHQCLQQLAMVPSTSGSFLTEGIGSLAKYALMVPKPLPHPISSERTVQYFWRPSSSDEGGYRLYDAGAQTTMSPYHSTLTNHSPSLQEPAGEDSTKRPTWMPLETIKSHLDPNGGMHRLFHHSITIENEGHYHHRHEGIDTGNKNNFKENRFIVIIVVPQGMFIDLDDPLEAATTLFPTGSITTLSSSVDTTFSEPSPASVSSTKHSTTTTPPRTYKFASINDDGDDVVVATITATLHTATICDIEQPAFVSGQHILFWEILVDRSKQMSMADVVIKFATKLHLRYPHPRSTHDEWIDLPHPMLFAVIDDRDGEGKYQQQLQQPSSEELDDSRRRFAGWNLPLTERVWIATAKESDHDVVMGVTIVSCLIGVLLMLRDLSRVSTWDNV